MKVPTVRFQNEFKILIKYIIIFQAPKNLTG